MEQSPRGRKKERLVAALCTDSLSRVKELISRLKFALRLVRKKPLRRVVVHPRANSTHFCVAR